MIKGNGVIIEGISSSKKEAVIKNEYGINLGIIRKLDFNNEDKIAIIRIRVFKEDERKRLMEEILEMLGDYIFNELEYNKLSIIANPDTDLNAFLNVGFSLEGILEDAYMVNGNVYNQLIFGMNSFCYSENLTKRRFIIPGSRLELKLLTPELAEEYTEYCVRNKDHLAPYEPLRDSSYYSIDAQREILMDDYTSYLNGKCVPLGIFFEDEFIGRIKVSNIIFGVFKSATLGYSIDEGFQGRGFMQEAVKLVIRYCFRDLDIHRIEASAMTDNIKSQKVLEKLQFKKLGINEKYLFINGEWRDHVTYYITKNN